MKAVVTDSQFYMWRAIFSLAHADRIVTQEEKKFMIKTLSTVNFSPDQRKTLQEDMEQARDTGAMFSRISDPQDRSRFFYFARILLWSDGSFDGAEQKILTDLGRFHNKTVDISALMGQPGMEFQDDHKDWLAEDIDAGYHRKGFIGALDRFLSRFTS